ncbi:MAG: hypothetical protein M1334_00175 [Patescibacteria group bacterium]|nr:hypothetical protein [Patescibacteria group bacterium]
MVKILSFLVLAIPFGFVSFKVCGNFRSRRAKIKKRREMIRTYKILAECAEVAMFGKNGNVMPMKMPRTRKKFWLFGKTVIVD